MKRLTIIPSSEVIDGPTPEPRRYYRSAKAAQFELDGRYVSARDLHTRPLADLRLIGDDHPVALVERDTL